MTNADSTAITSVRGREVWDSRGRPTIEVEVELAGGARGRAIAPAGASRGRGEAVDLRDGGTRLDGLGVTRAVAGVDAVLARALRSRDAVDQEGVDEVLVDADGSDDRSRLGGNALVATSMAVAHAAAAAAGVPLWRWIRDRGAPSGDRMELPMPEVQVIGGGAHASRRVDLQDFMVVPVGAATFRQALEWVAACHRATGIVLAEAGGGAHGVADEGGHWPDVDGNEAAIAALTAGIERAGFEPGRDVAIALDVASSEFGRDGCYTLTADADALDSGAWTHRLTGWIDRFPVVSVEDPLAEDDLDAFAAFTAAVGDRVQVVGDDLTVTDAARVETAARVGAANALLVKPNQVGTLTEAKAAFDAARKAGWETIVSARSGESEDVTIVHLALGWGADGLKVGSIVRGERTAKWNEMLRIEDRLGPAATLARPRLGQAHTQTHTQTRAG
ncbi:MAG: enolase C-terminal domain-like protein [Acidimicrobiia bacterium]